ncbi:MAG: methionyl-tRNA formyltransferase [Deltaproteobacteria bacterium]|nr:methionyl-tRNA formyltransferase [Deltaproteobacteria bacterium]
MTQTLRLVFMGTPAFAVPSLQAVLAGGFEVAAVVTQPDRPQGRGQQLKFSPVKTEASARGISVLQPRLKGQADILDNLRQIKPDLILVVAFGQMLCREILAIPSLGVLNVHASLLPRYRGAAPINWAIINGEGETGVTIMWLVQKMDAGDIFLQEAEPISSDDTAGTLGARLAVKGARLLVEALHAVRVGNIIRTPQPSQGITFAPVLTKEMQHLDFSRPAVELHRLIRGLDPKPGAFTYYQGKILKVFQPELGASLPHRPPPGTVLQATAAGVQVACGEGSLWLRELQLAGRKRLSALEFARGQKLTHMRLG